jgi:hypothetical protein
LNPAPLPHVHAIERVERRKTHLSRICSTSFWELVEPLGKQGR